MGTGVIQCGGGVVPEIKDRLMSRLSAASGRRLMYNNIQESVRAPGRWKQHLAIVQETCTQGNRAVPLCTPNSSVSFFNMKNCQTFRQLPTWQSIMGAADEEKLRAYGDPEIRAKLRSEIDAPPGPDARYSKRWDLLFVAEPALSQNQELKGKSVEELAQAWDKEPLDAFLDLAVKEELNTVFGFGQNNSDRNAVAEILSSPYTVIGLSDGGAHVQFRCLVGYSTRLLGYWVRERGIMSLEQAIRRLTFDSASAFGIYDRGLLQPGLAADFVIFNPDTVKPGTQDVVHDLPNNGWRMRDIAEGIHYTVVNGEVLLEQGEPTGANPGHVLRNALYNAAHPNHV